jgi:DNA (cytosine-5)-methyltransferase 1
MKQPRPHLNGIHRNGKPVPDLFGFFGTSFDPGWPDQFGNSLEKWADEAGLPTVRTLSLFSGAGGLDVGFHQAGFDVQIAVEHDPACVRTLRANVGSGRLFRKLDIREADVSKFNPPPDAAFDLVLGCPPCQSFSAAGRRAEGVDGTSEERGTLFRAYIRLLISLRPKAFLFENVAGITGANQGRAWAEILAAFVAAGYRVAHRVLNAADFGVAQHRERVILVGVRNDLGITFRFPSPTHGPDSPSGRLYCRADVAIRGVRVSAAERRVTPGGRYGHLLADIPPGLNYSYYTAQLGHPVPVFAWRSKFSDFLYKADPTVPVRTLKADDGGFTGPFHWNARPFTAGEKKRLQTIPDDYELCGNKGEVNSQIGNAVPCQFARILALAVRSQVFGAELPFRLPTLAEDDELGFRGRKRLLTQLYQQRAAVSRRRCAATPSNRVTPTPRTYRARWGDDFELVEDPNAETGIWVDVGGTPDCWKVRASHERVPGPTAFAVTLTPNSNVEWPTRLERIELWGDRLDEVLFAAVWRALDAELTRHAGLADLVQLNGFYRNCQAVVCSLTFGLAEKPNTVWKALAGVLQRRGVGTTLTTRKLAVAWELEVKQVKPFAKFLRLLGYEVRSSNTNRQIGPGRFLVPYPFPTLTPKSVQGRKPL